VTVKGSGFTGATSVNFGAVAGTAVTVASDTQLTVVSPPVSPAGQAVVDVTVVTPVSGTSATGVADQFTYVQPPTVSAIRPPSGPVAGKTQVSVIGSGFLTATGVNFGSVAAESFAANGDELIIGVSPAGKSGAVVDITVTNPGGTSAAVAGDKFTYLGQPSVTLVVPGSGKSTGGAVVAIFGSGFTMANSVMFGNLPARLINVAEGEITVVTPPGQGTVAVTVTNPVGTSAVNLLSRYTYTASSPTVTGVNPRSALVGQTVVISGSGFSAGVTAVNFGSVPATSFSVVSDSQINAVVPFEGGTVDITVTNSGGTSATGPADQFTIIVIQ
jgi:hypothetical protein